ncbi:MAG: SPOR domain-containing protein [Moraxella sp.]|nr:SPOR domain-containing protein [Moraxella sp.]
MLKEVLLGIALMVGGLVLAMAVLLKPDEPPKAAEQTKPSTTSATSELVPATNLVPVKREEVTVDLQTEASVLEDKYKDRQAELKQKTAEAEALRVQQEQARELALKKSELEAQQVNNRLEVKPRPESEALAQAERTDAEKKAAEQAKTKGEQIRAEQQARSKTEQQAQNNTSKVQNVKAQKSEANKDETAAPKTYVVRSGDSLIRLSRQFNVPVSAIAEMNGMGRNDALQRGRTIRLPSARDVKNLELKAQKREKQETTKQTQEQKRKDINDRLVQARREARRSGVNDRYVVQVALATDQKKANELAKQYRKAGYAVQTIKEGRGVRVIVGSERSKEAATLLKEKINHDPSVSANGAWVVKK